VTSTIGTSTARRTSSISPCSVRRRRRSTAANGSSSSSTRGSRARARATATRWRSPPDNAGGLAVGAMGQVHEREQLERAASTGTPRPVAERRHDVAECRQVREERVLLEDDPHVASMRRDVHGGGRVEPGLRHPS
jgi:hypothetical protein